MVVVFVCVGMSGLGVAHEKVVEVRSIRPRTSDWQDLDWPMSPVAIRIIR
jgi:hypothetical protein